MARPKVFDYDAASDETIVTAGVEGAQLTWMGINPITQPDGKEPYMHMVFIEGVLNAGGDAIETKTRGPVQVNLEGQEFTDFYVSNKATFDELHRKTLEYVAQKYGKTGSVIEV
jgi:hypothetical protein